MDGRFTLKVPQNANSLIVTFVGFTASEVALTNAKAYKIVMQSEQIAVDEVVVVAYGTAKKSAITGAAAQISAAKLANRPLNNISKAIEGSTPGVQVTTGNGQPGSSSDIRIRGFGSINASSAPLYVVDGVPYTLSISNLNMDDVENVSILKDASSTALYGSRAANGVVLITTKKGKMDKDRIQFKVSQGFSERGLPEYDRVNAYQYYPLMWEYYRNGMVNRTSSPQPMATASQIASGLVAGQAGIKDKLGYNPFNVDATTIVSTDGVLNPSAKLLWADDLDWASPLQRVGKRGDYSMNLNGGTAKTQYYMSLGYLNDKGFLIKSDFERFNGRVSVDSKIKDWMKVGLSITGNMTKSNTANDGSSTGYVNPFFFARTIAPIYPVYAHNQTTGDYILDANGNKQYDFGNSNVAGVPQRAGYGGRHIVAETEFNNNLFKRNVISSRTYAEFYLLDGLKLSTNVGLDVSSYNASSFDNKFVGDGAPAGRSSRTNSLTTTLTVNQLLNYTKTFNKHNVEALLGHESYKYQYNYLYGFRQGLIVDGNDELVNFTTTNSLTSYSDNDRIESYITRFNYNYNSKYYATASYRRDGSSRFSPDGRWGNFFGFGAAWRVDQEEFMKKFAFVDLLKVRTSYGETGNNDAGLYAWQALYFINNNSAESGFLQSTLANKDLTWEKNGSFDVAVEFDLFKRVSGSVEFYKRQSSNLLFSVPQPLSGGVESLWKNIGTMYNQGVEVQLGVDIVKVKDFKWNLSVNASTVKNVITKLPQKEIINGSKKLMVDHSMYDYWLREWKGVDPADGWSLYRANPTSYAADKAAYDLNPASTGIKDYRISGVDTLTTNSNKAKYHYADSAIPKLFGSVSNTFTYKNLELAVMVTYSIGGKIYETNYASLMTPGYGTTAGADVLKRWTKPGDVTSVPRLDEAWSTYLNAASDRWLIDASYLNLKQVSLSYVIPEKYASKVFINNARVFVSAENLKLYNALNGMNNQQNFNGTVSNVYLPARTFTLGVNFSL
jgi:TonB-linked SusC/RagA family outer membrane protein